MEYTLCITSCGRHDLLQKTLASLVLDIPPKDILIMEDGPSFLGEIPGVTWMTKDQRRGQIDSADKLMQAVSTPYVLWCEDDWQFSEPVSGWLPQSQEILDKFPEIFTVSLRHKDCNGHPLTYNAHYPFLIQQPEWHGFGSFCFNPGLRRLSDYQRMGTYADLSGPIVPGCINEQAISMKYFAAGYRIADLGRCVAKHTGNTRSKANDKI